MHFSLGIANEIALKHVDDSEKWHKGLPVSLKSVFWVFVCSSRCRIFFHSQDALNADFSKFRFNDLNMHYNTWQKFCVWVLTLSSLCPDFFCSISWIYPHIEPILSPLFPNFILCSSSFCFCFVWTFCQPCSNFVFTLSRLGLNFIPTLSSLFPNFVLTFSLLCPYFVLILSRLWPHFLLPLFWLCPLFVPILSSICPHFVLTMSATLRLNFVLILASLCPDFVLSLSQLCHHFFPIVS